MNTTVFMVCYSKQHFDNIVVNKYELDHETPSYLYLKEYGGVVSRKKDKVEWFYSLEAATEHVKSVVADKIAKLEKELERLKNIKTFSIYNVPSEQTFVNPLVID